jgi:hypothetical protein
MLKERVIQVLNKICHLYPEGVTNEPYSVARVSPLKRLADSICCSRYDVSGEQPPNISNTKGNVAIKFTRIVLLLI